MLSNLVTVAQKSHENGPHMLETAVKSVTEQEFAGIKNCLSRIEQEFAEIKNEKERANAVFSTPRGLGPNAGDYSQPPPALRLQGAGATPGGQYPPKRLFTESMPDLTAMAAQQNAARILEAQAAQWSNSQYQGGQSTDSSSPGYRAAAGSRVQADSRSAAGSRAAAGSWDVVGSREAGGSREAAESREPAGSKEAEGPRVGYRQEA